MHAYVKQADSKREEGKEIFGNVFAIGRKIDLQIPATCADIMKKTLA